MSRRSSPTFNVVSGVNGEGLSTSVLPASSAGAIFQKASVSGKFHGVMAATTPSGRRVSSTWAESSSWITCVGISRFAKYWLQMAEAKTSMAASLSGLPCSAVSTGARSADEANSTSAACSRMARRAASSAFHSRVALAAASNAASSCWLVHAGAWAKTSPVAGLRTPNVSSAGAASPAMVMTKSGMALLGWTRCGDILSPGPTTPLDGISRRAASGTGPPCRRPGAAGPRPPVPQQPVRPPR